MDARALHSCEIASPVKSFPTSLRRSFPGCGEIHGWHATSSASRRRACAAIRTEPYGPIGVPFRSEHRANVASLGSIFRVEIEDTDWTRPEKVLNLDFFRVTFTAGALLRPHTRVRRAQQTEEILRAPVRSPVLPRREIALATCAPPAMVNTMITLVSRQIIRRSLRHRRAAFQAAHAPPA